MASIPGAVWVVIGVVVGVFSWIVKEAANQKGMYFFIALAVIFVFVGIVKIIWAASKKNKKKAQPFPTYNSEVAMQQSQANESISAQSFKRPGNTPVQHNMYNTRIILCPNCRTRNYNHSNFCHICGARLKR